MKLTEIIKRLKVASFMIWVPTATGVLLFGGMSQQYDSLWFWGYTFGPMVGFLIYWILTGKDASEKWSQYEPD